MGRTITYTWHLAELMARNGMHNSTDLPPNCMNTGWTCPPPKSPDFRTPLKRGIVMAHQTAKVTPTISQDDRLEWIRALLTGHDESRPHPCPSPVRRTRATPHHSPSSTRRTSAPPAVATMLGYAQVIHLHVAASGETFAEYVHDARVYTRNAKDFVGADDLVEIVPV